MAKVENRHRLTWLGYLRNFVRRRPVWITATMIIHLLIFLTSFFLAVFFRFDLTFSADALEVFYPAVFVVLAVKMIVFYIQRHFRSRWFYATVKDLQMVVYSAAISLLILTFADAYHKFLNLPQLPRSILIIDFGTTIMLLGGVRLLLRFVRENVATRGVDHLSRAFFVGANSHGGKIVEIINTRKDSGFYVVGFLTRHQYKAGMQISYIPILGMIDDLPRLASKHRVHDVLIVAGTLAGPEFRHLHEVCQKHSLELRVIPAGDIVPSRKIPIREIDINDLLRREPVKLDTDMISGRIRGRRVLVTGAGGSIGSEICRQLLTFEPSELILLGRGENRIFFLQRELEALKKTIHQGNSSINTKIYTVIANVVDVQRIKEVFEQFHPEVVYHAAAHKHVPLMEQNICEAVYNNVYGTGVVALAADRYGTERFVLISTDKAVNPTSVMGTTKCLAERFVNTFSQKSKTKFIVTRFGNVLGSAGSVVPVFRQQIQQGGPITITDRRMTRFFMTIPEAAQLVLEASAFGKGGEIFVLDMGEPVKIIDLAHDMVRLAGLPEDSIEIVEIGMRPGEKLYEELYSDSEKRLPTKFPKLFAAEARSFDVEEVQSQIADLVDLSRIGDEKRLRAQLAKLVPEYGAHLDQ